MAVFDKCPGASVAFVVMTEDQNTKRIKTNKTNMTTNNTNTVRLHRVLRARPERVYRAFLDADALAKWLPPNGFTCKVHQIDAKVGGTFKMSFTNFTTGKSHSFGGKYLDLKPHRSEERRVGKECR